MPTPVRIGIDIGGTFTDFVVFPPDGGPVVTLKLPSTPEDPARAVVAGLRQLSENPGWPAAGQEHIVHGSTVATNALLERKGAVTALVTTRGFRDVLKIARQNRPALYDLFAEPVPPLVPDALRLEVDERMGPDGQVLKPLAERQVEALIPVLHAQRVASVAICLLFSFADPSHEQAIARRLREADLAVSVSSEILPEFREYERTVAAVLNAYVSPVMDRYLGRLQAELGSAELRVMQSNGGRLSASQARREAVRCILSGPAGGVVGAQAYLNQTRAQEAGSAQPGGIGRVMTFDMGGTSTDVAMVMGEPLLTTEGTVAGYPLKIPILDIHTVGSGGGSLARVDAGGALRVGPESAGAVPGPACYGLGDRPTVTDANLVLGRLVPEHFLGGRLNLDARRAELALAHLGSQMSLGAAQAALGVISVANAHMERALRVISVERGHDPRGATLFTYGGAGGLHAAELARRLGISKVIVPREAATFSALGMLLSEVIRDYVRTIMVFCDTPIGTLRAHLAPLLARGRSDLRAEGVDERDIRLVPSLDMRYEDQSYELSVPFDENPLAAFRLAHEQVYGFSDPQARVMVVNVRVRALGRLPGPKLAPNPGEGSDSRRARLGLQQVFLADGPREVPLYRGEALRPGNRLRGPALVVRDDTTILVGPDDHAEVDAYHGLWLHIGPRPGA